MPSYEHNQLLKRIGIIDAIPEDAAEYGVWIQAQQHLDLLEHNAKEDELIIYASGPSTFIHAVVVDENSLSLSDTNQLLDWSGNPFGSSVASYTWGGGRDDVWIDRESNLWRSDAMRKARHLVFARQLEGSRERDSLYYEILQEYAHLADIYWQRAERAYCRFNELGDIEHVVSITPKGLRDAEDITLVSFKREALEGYLAASNSVLVRMYEFNLFKRGDSSVWADTSDTIRKQVRKSRAFFYRQIVNPGRSVFTRGVQIIRPSRPKSAIFSQITDGWGLGLPAEDKYCEFIAWDWRNGQITEISTNPSDITSYFDAQNNSRPFETSPVFFRPEVLSKYKTDRDKYTISEEHRRISCRDAWELRTYDVNEAGQVHTYICYLGQLPYEEQLHWKSFNEEPKAGISQRAIENDFKGEPSDTIDPLVEILFIVGGWRDASVTWWELRDSRLVERVNTPLTTSRDEWAQAFLDLSQLVIEGFKVKGIRQILMENGIAFEKNERSLALIEKVLISRNPGQRLNGLREVQAIRSKVASHSGGSGADELATAAQEEHGSYTAHFESVCRTVVDELKTINAAFS